jgi:hypothetical protein
VQQLHTLSEQREQPEHHRVHLEARAGTRIFVILHQIAHPSAVRLLLQEQKEEAAAHQEVQQAAQAVLPHQVSGL